MKRRDAIKTLGALAGAAGSMKFLSACGGGDDGPVGITNYVYLMMENRSYDHYLGARSLIEGKPGNGLTAGLSNPDLDGNEVEIWAANADYTQQCVIDPPHGWDPSRVQFAGGANTGFLVAHQEDHAGDVNAIEPMQYMLREQVPVTNALADAYTSCDAWYSAILGPTLPNRMYWHAATSNLAKSNDEVLGGAFEGLTSIHHQCDAAGIDWAYYYGDVPVLAVIKDLELEGRLRRFLYDFIDDAAAGKLPTICHIDPGFGSNDDHPPHHPMLGQMLISAVYTAIATGPQWKNTMLVITYDENGGFYDHVAPPTAPDDHAAEGFDQLGFRVPAMVIGPYAKSAYVSSVQYDHTSALKHLQNAFGLEPMTMRQAAANDLTDAIDMERLDHGDWAQPIELPYVEIDELSLPDICINTNALKPGGGYDHDVLAWADANASKLGKWDLRGQTRDYVYGIAEYLDHHNLGRIRRRR